jgi:1,4-alpha-glucan branching enzyme
MNLEQNLAAPPANASAAMEAFAARSARDQPVSIYEIHLDSWRRVPEEGNRPLACEEISPQLAGYLQFLGFTHALPYSHSSCDPPNLGILAQALHHAGVELIPGNPPGFDYQWDTPWVDNILDYLATDPLYRKFQHNRLPKIGNRTLGKFILPLSHDLVIPGRKSLLARMPGDDWQKFATLRLLLAFTYALPGKKLLFMGGEFGQWNPWNPETSLDWHIVNTENRHGQLQRWVSHLNSVYRSQPALFQLDFHENGFAWLETADSEQSVITFLRRSANPGETIIAVLNFTPMPRHNYRIGAPSPGYWREILNSDALEYGGSGQGNLGGVESAPFGWHFQPCSLTVTLPPLGAVFFRQ